MTEESASKQIDKIIEKYGGWKADTLKKLRETILDSGADITEEVKWKMPTRPEGLPVWYHNGIVCLLETFKNDQKLVFTKGAIMDDPNKLFNARMNSSTDRAIEFHEGDNIDETAIKSLVRQAVEINNSKTKQ